jgi:hypothetical protein
VTDELDAKLARITDRISQRAVTARDELEAIGWLATSGYLRERFGTQKFWLRTPRVEHGDPYFNGCDLSKPGPVPGQGLPPKVQDDSGPQGSRPARPAKGRDPSGEGGGPGGEGGTRGLLGDDR